MPVRQSLKILGVPYGSYYRWKRGESWNRDEAWKRETTPSHLVQDCGDTGLRGYRTAGIQDCGDTGLRDTHKSGLRDTHI